MFKLIITLLSFTTFFAQGNLVLQYNIAQQDSVEKEKEEKPKENPGLPLIPGRTLEYTADEGSWMSLDVSPDGKTIVFDLLGDIYTIPFSGGKATRITSGLAFDAQPRFSPDGKKLVFISDSTGSGNLWIYDFESKKRKTLTNGSGSQYFSPDFTPDGNYVVASKGPGRFAIGKLWIYHIDGGSGTQIISSPNPGFAGIKMIGAAFAKDGRFIWYAQRSGDWQYNAVFPQYQIVRYDRETGDTETITSRYGSAVRPTLSPDGKYLVYATRYNHETGLVLRDLKTSEERWLAYPVQRDDQESRATLDVYPGFSFTPNSKNVVVTYNGKIWNISVDGSKETEIKFTADVKIPLGPEVRFDYEMSDSKEFDVKQIRHPKVSPDGKHMVFTALDRLWIRDMKTKKNKRLTKQDVGEFYPSWSPDSKWIAFSTWDDEKGGYIYKVSASGRSLTKLTKLSALYFETAWSPNGSRIISTMASDRDLKESIGYFSGGQDRKIIYVTSNGKTVNEVAPAEGRSMLHFTSDNNRIYAYSFNKGLVSFKWDGTDEKSHLKITGRTVGTRPSLADFIMMAPKGDQAMAQMLNQLYVVTVPQIGTAATINVANPNAASFPSRQLTDIGGEFPSWNKDGTTVYWSIGNAFHWYDLNKAKEIDDIIKKEAEEKKKADEAEKEKNEKLDKDKQEKEDSDKDEDGNTVKKEDEKKKTEAYKAELERIIVKAKRDLPQGEILLSGARLVTMNAYEIIESGDIHIKDNKIVAIGPKGSLNLPAGIQTMDMTGKTITPGFIDTHAHPQWLTWDLHNTQSWQFLTNLAYGVTTTRDPQTATTDILSYADMITTGNMIGPRTYSTGPGVFNGESINKLEDAKNVLKRYSDYYDTKTFKMYMTGDRKTRQYLIMAARELELMPTTEGGLDFQLNLTHAMDGYSGLEHSLPVTPVFNDVKELFAKSQITYSPTLLVSYGGPFGENYYYTREDVYGDKKLKHFTPYNELASKTLRRNGFSGWFHEDEHVFKRHAEFLKDLIPAGGRVGVGSHGQLQGLGYHWELWSVQSGGLSTHDALRAATILGAEGIGFGKVIGSLEAGKYADLIIFNSNPLDNIRNSNSIHYVMKNGRLYEGNSLDEVYPRKKKLANQYWQNTAPKTKAGIKK